MVEEEGVGEVTAVVPTKTVILADQAKKMGVKKYPAITYNRHETMDDDDASSSSNNAKFTLHIEAGSLREAECVVLMGENGTGKTTFMEMLAGRLKNKNKGKGSSNSLLAGGDGGGSVSYKLQGEDPKLRRRFKGTVQDLLEKEINTALGDWLFRLLVLKPLQIEQLQDLSVSTLSGGEMQRLAITLCLGKPGSPQLFLIDEPSAGLDCEQRVIAAKVIKRWVVHHLNKPLVLVEHDFVMASAMADHVIVFEGIPGIECTARAPKSVAEGFNSFLQRLDVTFRRDPDNYRPRINKRGSRIDKEQKAKGEYYKLAVVEEETNA